MKFPIGVAGLKQLAANLRLILVKKVIINKS